MSLYIRIPNLLKDFFKCILAWGTSTKRSNLKGFPLNNYWISFYIIWWLNLPLNMFFHSWQWCSWLHYLQINFLIKMTLFGLYLIAPTFTTMIWVVTCFRTFNCWSFLFTIILYNYYYYERGFFLSSSIAKSKELTL